VRLSDSQMSKLAEAAYRLGQRYPSVLFNVSQSDEYDAQMTLISTLEGEVGSYLTDGAPQLGSAAHQLYGQAISDALAHWRSATATNPAVTGPEAEPLSDQRTRWVCTLSA
jgi:hypothetical protein